MLTLKKTKKILFLSLLGLVLAVMCFISLPVSAQTDDYIYIRHSGTDGLYNSSLEYLIDDSKSSNASECMNESYDQFTLYDTIGYTKADLIEEGYKTVKIYISIDVKEAYNCNGTQTFHYRVSSTSTVDKFTPVSITHEGSAESREYKTYNLKVAIKVSDITDKICLRYSSSGSNSKCAWYNTNLKIRYDFSYDELDNGYFTLT